MLCVKLGFDKMLCVEVRVRSNVALFYIASAPPRQRVYSAYVIDRDTCSGPCD